MRKLRVLALMHKDLVPPDSIRGLSESQVLEWKTEYDVTTALSKMGHEVLKLGVQEDLTEIARGLESFQPHLTFNLLEEFHGVTVYDYYVAGYLELMKQAYTGCNPRGLMMARDKALAKQILLHHRILTPRFTVYPKGRAIRPPKRLEYPLFVKSTVEDASLGLTKKSIVRDFEQLQGKVDEIHGDVGTDVLAEEYIEGRELYLGILGNERLQMFPIWELLFRNLPAGEPNIATERVKWDYAYQKKVGVITQPADNLDEMQRKAICRVGKRVYRALGLSGYARLDFRMREDGRVYVLEANPNPNLSRGEDFAASAQAVGLDYQKLLERIVSLGLNYRPLWRA